jgi:F-type H+-transporting ATPase subunit b
VESIVTNLHLDLTAFIWHSVTFVVLVVALWWLLFRPLTRLVDERKAHIAASLLRAEEIDRQAATTEAERAALIASAHREAREIRRRAQDQMDRYVVRARAEANADAERIRQQATLRQGSASIESGAEDSGPSERDLEDHV